MDVGWCQLDTCTYRRIVVKNGFAAIISSRPFPVGYCQLTTHWTGVGVVGRDNSISGHIRGVGQCPFDT